MRTDWKGKDYDKRNAYSKKRGGGDSKIEKHNFWNEMKCKNVIV